MNKVMTPDEILRLREICGDTQEQFGERLGGVTGRTIRRYEAGENVPTPMVARRLVEVRKEREHAGSHGQGNSPAGREHSSDGRKQRHSKG